jgi:hypothetical protein
MGPPIIKINCKVSEWFTVSHLNLYRNMTEGLIRESSDNSYKLEALCIAYEQLLAAWFVA